jgi:hypothetical protein
LNFDNSWQISGCDIEDHNMNECYPQQQIRLSLKIAAQGILFLFHHSNGGTGDTLQVEQSWSSVHILLSRLRKSQRYCAKDVPLLVWKQGEELYIKFFDPESQAAEECVLSGEETKRILAMLGGLPSLN